MVDIGTVSNPLDGEDVAGLASVLDDVISGSSIVVFTDDLRVATLRANDANWIIHTELTWLVLYRRTGKPERWYIRARESGKEFADCLRSSREEICRGLSRRTETNSVRTCDVVHHAISLPYRPGRIRGPGLPRDPVHDERAVDPGRGRLEPTTLSSVWNR